MAVEKRTKSDMFTEIRDLMDAEGNTDLAEFAQKEIDSLAAKAVKAHERSEAKKAEVDEYKSIVAGALTDELQTGNDIFTLVGDEEFTLGKVRARLTALVKDGSATKEQVKGEKNTVMAYKLA